MDSYNRAHPFRLCVLGLCFLGLLFLTALFLGALSLRALSLALLPLVPEDCRFLLFEAGFF